MSERLIPESQLKEEVRRALLEILTESQISSRSRRYLPTKVAYKELGYGDRTQLYDAVAAGLFRVGAEVQDRRKPQGKLARYYFDIDACQRRLKELPEKRK